MEKNIVGDNVHICTDRLTTSYSSDEKNDLEKVHFDFVVSHLRIRIEMAFRMMTEKLQILTKLLSVLLKYACKVIIAITHLHIFYINKTSDLLKMLEEDDSGSMVNNCNFLTKDASQKFIRADLGEQISEKNLSRSNK